MGLTGLRLFEEQGDFWDIIAQCGGTENVLQFPCIQRPLHQGTALFAGVLKRRTSCRIVRVVHTTASQATGLEPERFDSGSGPGSPCTGITLPAFGARVGAGTSFHSLRIAVNVAGCENVGTESRGLSPCIADALPHFHLENGSLSDGTAAVM